MTITRAVADLKVVDLTQQLPGPFATALLVTLGARVIKVEPPSGDPARVLDPTMFGRVNDGKLTVTLDLKTESDQSVLHQLIGESDVLVESFRPGVAARLGADWDTCRELNPRLVHCSITGFGPQGPYAQVPVHDLNLMAWGDPVGARRSSGHIGVPWVDLGTGSIAALAMLAAWHDSCITGQGRHIDVAMQDVALSWSRVKPVRTEVEPTYALHQTADGHEIVIAILEDHFWVRLCRAFALEDLAAEPTLTSYAGRRERGEEIHRRLEQAVGRLTLSAVLALAEEFDIPVTTALPQDDPRALEHLRGSGFEDGAFRLPLN